MWDYGLPHNPVAATEKFKAVVLAYEALAALNEADASLSRNVGMCAQCGTASVACKEGAGKYSGVLYCLPCWVPWLDYPDGGAHSKTIGNGDMLGDPPEDHGGPTKLNDTATEQAADAQSSAIPTMLPFIVKSSPLTHPKHFDFIEVGTSDWGTLTQFCAGVKAGSMLASDMRTSIDSLRWVRGLAVEPVREHLDALPQLPRVSKVEAAMGEISGDATLYMVSTENVQRYLYKNPVLGYVMWYAKSLSCVGRPHPQLSQMLREVGRDDLLEQRSIRVLSWADLCTLHGVASVDIVQLDCEGMDCAVLRGLLTHCENNPASLPRLIQFEAKAELTAPDEIHATLAALVARGYSIWMRGPSNVIVERSS